MSLTTLTPLAFALGLAGLAGVLYLLQRLRVRHREIDVVTTLFWGEALQETRARVLVRRFRHPLAYAFVLAIASLLWLAFAGPRGEASEGREYVCLLDASAGMGRASRLEAARARLLEVADELPAERRTVLVAGTVARTLLAPGEEALLLEARLEGIRPAAAPASVIETIEELAAARAGETTVLVFGDAPLDDERLALLPAGFLVERVATGDPDAPRQANRGITALGAALAASGAWDAVDVLVELTGDELEARGELAVRLDGEAAALVAETVRSEDRARTLVFRDVPARGQRFEVSLAGDDALALDDAAALLLPDRPRLRVSLSPSLDAPLRPVLEADPALVLVDSRAEVYVARSGDAVPAATPALRFVPAAEQAESFLVTFTGEREAEEVLRGVVGELGLEEIDSTGLAEAAAQPITVGARPGAAREIAVWEELIGGGFDFVDSRSFPLFVARSLRWLVGVEELRPWAVAGEAVSESVAFRKPGGARLDPVGVPFTPPVAGDYATDFGGALVAALASPASTESRAWPGSADPAAGADGDSFDPLTWLLLLAVALLVIEWFLVRTGRMP